jgi:hypothetical protein
MQQVTRGVTDCFYPLPTPCNASQKMLLTHLSFPHDMFHGMFVDVSRYVHDMFVYQSGLRREPRHYKNVPRETHKGHDMFHDMFGYISRYVSRYVHVPGGSTDRPRPVLRFEPICARASTDRKGFITGLRHHPYGCPRPRSYTNFPSTNQPTNVMFVPAKSFRPLSGTLSRKAFHSPRGP